MFDTYFSVPLLPNGDVQPANSCVKMLYCLKCDAYTAWYDDPIFTGRGFRYRHDCAAFASLSSNWGCVECDEEVLEIRQAVKCPHCDRLFIADGDEQGWHPEGPQHLFWSDHFSKAFNKILLGPEYELEKDICEDCGDYAEVSRTAAWILCDWCLERRLGSFRAENGNEYEDESEEA